MFILTKCIVMGNVDKIKLLKDNLREEIEKDMMNLVHKFKEYVRVDHDDNPKYEQGKYNVTRINYGIKKHIYPDIPQSLENVEDDNYYCYLPNSIKFIYNNKLLNTNLVFYNNKSNFWFVYNCDHFQKKFSLSKLDTLDLDIEENFVEFNCLDTDTQIEFLEQLENILK